MDPRFWSLIGCCHQHVHCLPNMWYRWNPELELPRSKLGSNQNEWLDNVKPTDDQKWPGRWKFTWQLWRRWRGIQQWKLKSRFEKKIFLSKMSSSHLFLRKNLNVKMCPRSRISTIHLKKMNNRIASNYIYLHNYILNRDLKFIVVL